MTEEYGIKIVERNGLRLYELPFQTIRICKAAISNNALAIRYVDNPTPSLYRLALKKDWRSMAYMKEAIFTDALYEYALKVNLDCIQYMKKFQTPELCLDAVSKNPTLLKHVRSDIKTSDFYINLVSRNSRTFYAIPKEEQTEEICWAALDNSDIKTLIFRNIRKDLLVKLQDAIISKYNYLKEII